MNETEAEKILRIMVTADGYCPTCAYLLFDDFLKEFPEFKKLAKKIWKEIFDEEIDFEEKLEKK